jgi:transcriptional regulator GlxA family with amidase domain
MEHAVTVEEMARDLAISPRHLERCFKETVGTSIKAFWTDRRMEHAARLLRQPGVAVTDVAVRVGYASPFAFSRTFKRRFGVAPSHAAGTSAVDPAALPSP